MSSSRSTDRSVRRSADGGIPARRAIARWAWRLFRREWRQQVLVLALLTVSVAAAIAGASAAYDLAPVPLDAEFGTANFTFTFQDPDPATTPAKLADAEQWFGSIDVISHRQVQVPGSVDTIDYRGQDPSGPFGDPMLDLRTGRYPTSPDEVAVTDWVAQTFDLSIGDSFALDGQPRTVVGMVEDPSDLGDEFALLAPDPTAPADSLTMLVDSSRQHAESYRPLNDHHRMISSRGAVAENVMAAIGVFVIAAIALFLVALVAAASFIVIAQRRQRQLGMLSALGATDRHMRLVMLWSGAVVGAVAAVAGSVIAVVGWIIAAPHLEDAVGFRIDAVDVPWWLIAVGMGLSVATAVGASWWPARSAARLPTVVALSGRPPRPTAVHRSALVTAIVLGIGIGCLLLAGDVAGDSSVSWSNLGLVGGGTLATIIGVLLLSPLAIRALARLAARLPIAMRLPLRDLARHQARSGAALAAISLALGVPVAVVATASAAEYSATAGNLSDHQLLLHGADLDGPFVPLAADDPALQEGAERVAATIEGATLTPIDVASDPQADPLTNDNGRDAIELAHREGNRYGLVSLLYVATPQLLAHYGIAADAAEPASGFLTRETVQLSMVGPLRKDAATQRPNVETVNDPLVLEASYTSLPGSFITPTELARRGWEAVPSGQWLIETKTTLTADQLSAARDAAAASGLTIETRDGQTGLDRLRTGATAVGIALALGILAMTVGLIRGEASDDVRTLTATGASSFTRRTLTAATSFGLAMLGAILGIAGAYIALAAGPFGRLSRLRHVPWSQLAMIGVGMPLVAACAGWLLAGREPGALSRRSIV